MSDDVEQAQPAEAPPKRIDEFLRAVLAQNGSDLHFVAGDPPRIRLYGDLQPLRSEPLGQDFVRELLAEIMTRRAQSQLEERDGADFAYMTPGVSRFRVNAFRHIGGLGAVFRAIPSKALTLQQLNMPEAVFFDYGTALLSRVPFTDSLDHAFRPSPPSMTKGLTLGQIAWRPDGIAGPIHVDIVSVHLDFSRDSVRKQQIAELAATLSDRMHPMIVLGDMNSDWSGNDSVVTELAHRCRMQVYQPLADDAGNLPFERAPARLGADLR